MRFLKKSFFREFIPSCSVHHSGKRHDMRCSLRGTVHGDTCVVHPCGTDPAGSLMATLTSTSYHIPMSVIPKILWDAWHAVDPIHTRDLEGMHRTSQGLKELHISLPASDGNRGRQRLCKEHSPLRYQT